MRGFGGCGYCDNCAADSPCSSATPVVASYTYAATAGTSMSYSNWGTNSPTGRTVTGTLPPGGTFNGPSTISGTPTSGGTYTVTIGASNACGSASGVLTITVSCGDCPLSGYGVASTGDANVICLSDTYSTVGYFLCSRNVTFSYELLYAEGQIRVVKNGGVVLYDTGCASPASTSVSISVPAGTTSLEVVLLCGCLGGAPTNFTYTLSC